jgi:uncharacterized protein (TIGR03086 family)
MSENLRGFVRAVYGMDAVVARTPEDRWEAPSPCEGWSARQVVGHQTGVFDGIALFAGGAEKARPQMPEDLTDIRGLWARSRDALLTALDQDGALQHEGKYWFGPMSVDDLLAITLWDPLTHAWDLATAVGLPAYVDPDLAERALAAVGPRRDQFQEFGLVGEAVGAPADADPVTRWLALVGRDPSRGVQP